ncbi:LCP family protein [Candidatus Peregrinibacteria bacterium]|nr:LCP family protein [Candidatus Peregrinibacteria bacterium]
MNFKKRRIRTNLSKIKNIVNKPAEETTSTNFDPEQLEHNSSKHSNNHSMHLLSIGAGIIILVALFWVAFSLIKNLDFGSIVFSFGKDLHKDDHKLTNFLLVGTGGAEHDGSNLTDTIIVASLDQESKTVKMLSLPRDLYIDDKETGGQRINKVYDTYLVKYKNSPKAMEKLGELITSLTDMPIHYYVKIDFDGFVKIVDAMGGVTVDVEHSIYDPNYPLGETDKYTTFKIDAGVQNLDGETALKFARSRKTTSDFDRAYRQQQLLSAIKEKAISLDILTNPTKIQSLYNSVADSIETNLSVTEIIELAKISKDIDKNAIQSRVITDDYTSCGGLLYTPVREYFGGAAVLLPAGEEYDEINKFSDNYFNSKGTLNHEIQVLNGTKTANLALTVLNRLSRDCLNVVYYGNASDRTLEKSVIYYNTDLPEESAENQKKIVSDNIPPEIAIIKKIFDAPVIEGIPPEYLESEKRANSKIVIEMGADYKSLLSKDAFDNLKYTTPVVTATEDKKVEETEHPLNSNENSADTKSTTEKSSTEKTTTSKPAAPESPINDSSTTTKIP